MFLFIIAAICAVIAATMAGFCLPNVDKQHRTPMLLLIAIFAAMSAWFVILGSSVVC